MSDNKIDLTEFKETPAVKRLRKMSKSQSRDAELRLNAEHLNEVAAESLALKGRAAEPPKTRGRKSKYSNDEERKQARRQQQKDYRLRKKQELEDLKRQVADLEHEVNYVARGSAEHP